MSGSTATLVLGIIGDKLHADEDPKIYGYLLGGTVLISYVVCCPFFIWTGNAYHQKHI
jgi:hypothetical protein